MLTWRIQELKNIKPEATLYTDANVGQSILLRKGAGGIKHLSPKDVRAQEIVKQV